MNRFVEPAPLTLSVIDDSAAFANLANEWRALTEEASACFFMSWDWHYTWWQVYSTPQDRLYLVCFSLGDKLVGLLPMYSSKQGLALRHTLQFLGTGESRDDEVASEYLDVIAHPAFQKQVCEAAVDWLCQCEHWSRVELRCVLDDALLVQTYRSREDLSLIEKKVGHRFRFDLKHDEATHLNRLSPSRKKRIERSRRALVREGGLQQYSISRRAELNHAFQQLTEMNHERQAHKRRKSVFASEKFKLFHQLLVERLFEAGKVNIHQFKLNHNLLAVTYCFYDDDTCYYYQSGFSKRASNKFMPLTFAHLAEIDRCRETGLRYYDLMRAESPTYKEDFGCETTPMITTFLFCSKAHLNSFNARKWVRKQLVAALNVFGIKRNA